MVPRSRLRAVESELSLAARTIDSIRKSVREEFERQETEILNLRNQLATKDEEIEILRKNCIATSQWLDDAHGQKIDDWPVIFWWIRDMAEQAGEGVK